MLSELFGPPPTSRSEVREAKEFGAKVDEVAMKQLEKTAAQLELRAFAHDERPNAITALNQAEFRLWLECTPRVERWVRPPTRMSCFGLNRKNSPRSSWHTNHL